MKLLKLYQQAAAVSNRPLVAVVLEALRLRASRTRLGLFEYIDFQLYKNDLDWTEKQAFVGARVQRMLIDILVDDYSEILTRDKVTSYILLAGLGLPIPKLRAVFRSMRPSALPQVHTLEDLDAFLRETSNLPVYIKKSFGAYGRGNALITGYDGKHVMFGNGKSEPVQAFFNSLGEGRSLGWIFQEPLDSHPDIQKLTHSGKISGLRIHTFLSRNDVKITKAIFKVNIGTLDSDNFDHGASGNMLGAVDIKTGKIVRAISGVGPGQVENPMHPVTGGSIVGFTIPLWEEVVALVKQAQLAVPGFICPGWDIALCSDGPKILEVNSFGDADLSQQAYRTTFLDAEFLSLMRERGLEKLLFIPPDPRIKNPVTERTGATKQHWLW